MKNGAMVIAWDGNVLRPNRPQRRAAIYILILFSLEKTTRFVTEGMEGAVETIGAGFENFLKVAPKSS
jgi:hypothetical protein